MGLLFRVDKKEVENLQKNYEAMIVVGNHYCLVEKKKRFRFFFLHWRKFMSCLTCSMLGNHYSCIVGE